MALTTISDDKVCTDLVDVKYYEKNLGLEDGVPISLGGPECQVFQYQLDYFHCLPIAL